MPSRPIPPRPGLACPRLRLDEFGVLDAQDIVDLHEDPRMRHHLVDDYPLYTPDGARLFLARMQRIYREHEGLGIWRAERLQPTDPGVLAEAEAAVAEGDAHPSVLALLRQPGWAFCGWFNLMPALHRAGEVEIGARLMPQAWGGQWVLDGGEWLLGHAFDTLGRERVIGVCSPRNRSAIHCLRTLGFDAPSSIAYDGQDALEFRITARQWARARQIPRRERARAALKAGCGA
jgi:RimJ/RimL family protein N-acetyltransferase